MKALNNSNLVSQSRVDDNRVKTFNFCDQFLSIFQIYESGDERRMHRPEARAKFKTCEFRGFAHI